MAPTSLWERASLRTGAITTGFAGLLGGSLVGVRGAVILVGVDVLVGVLELIKSKLVIIYNPSKSFPC